MTCTATTCTTKGLTIAAKIAGLGKGAAPTATTATFGGRMTP